MAAVPSGSFLALSHPASDIAAAVMSKAATRLNRLMSRHLGLVRGGPQGLIGPADPAGIQPGRHPPGLPPGRLPPGPAPRSAC